MTSRREFLSKFTFSAAFGMMGLGSMPTAAFAAPTPGKSLIKVFMRGGADGLHLFPAVGDMNYYTHRPNIAIEAPLDSDANTALDVGNAYRGMNPNLSPLMEIWDAGRMMIAPATALEEGNRSHFDNQRRIGTGARDMTIDGYLNRYLQDISVSDHALRAAVLGKSKMSRELAGEVAVPTVTTSDSFVLENPNVCYNGCRENQLTNVMADLLSDASPGTGIATTVRNTQQSLVRSIDEARRAREIYQSSTGGLGYSNTNLGKGLKTAAELIKADVPLEVAALDWAVDWDTHATQVSNGANRFSDQSFGFHEGIFVGARDLLAFYRDLGPKIDDVVVLVATEFGRTVLENGSRGTDHGHGGPWFAFGGSTAPGFAPDIASLDRAELLQRRFVPMVTNYRDIVGEIMVRHMGMDDQSVATVFPNHQFFDHRLFDRNA